MAQKRHSGKYIKNNEGIKLALSHILNNFGQNKRLNYLIHDS